VYLPFVTVAAPAARPALLPQNLARWLAMDGGKLLRLPVSPLLLVTVVAHCMFKDS